MNPSAVMVVLSLGTPEEGAAAATALERWAAERGVLLETPGASAPALAEDPLVEQEVESLLEEARLAGAGTDAQAARDALERADHLLGANPALASAGWLRAERHRLLAELSTDDPPAAAALLRAARLLEGTRALAFPRQTDESDEEATSAPERDLVGVERDDVVEWDGREVRLRVRALAGQHHVRVLRGGRLLWAAWLDLAERGPIRLQAPPPAPCSADDLGSPEVTARGPRPTRPVTCPRWAVSDPRARPLRIATCEAARCGPWVSWRPSGPFSLPARPVSEAPALASGPSPLAWGLLGVTLGSVTAVMLWQHGAFGRDEPPPVWRFGGLR